MKQASWLVFSPPGVDDASALERLKVVRDGFTLVALIFGPLYFLARRLWLAALISAVLVGGAIAARIFLGLQSPFGALATLLPSLFMALEAGAFEQRKLLRTGWREIGVVRAPNAGQAEIRAIELLAAERVAGPAPVRETKPLPAVAPSPAFPATGPVLGLFPEAAGRP